jgi:drug/metabolite transporter (DMT)-like permease
MIALAFGLFAAFAFAVHDLVARSFAERTGPFRMAFWIMVVGAVLLTTLVWRSESFWMADRNTLLLAAANGVLYAAAVSSLLYAFSIAPVSIVGPFTAGYPALIVVWGIFTGLDPTPLQWLAVLMVVAGAIIVGRFGPDDGGLAAVAPGKIPMVIVSSVLTCLFYAATFLVGQHVASTLGAIEATFMTRVPAMLVLLPLMLRDSTRHGPIERKAWGGLLVMGLLDAVGVTSINMAAHYPGRELGAMAISCYGALAVLLAMVFLKEKVSPGQWGGIAMTILGIILLGN